MEDLRSRKRATNLEEDDMEKQPDQPATAKGKGVARSPKVILAQVLLAIVLIFILYLALVSSPINPTTSLYSPPLPHFSGILAPNKKLQNAVRLLENKIIGPESITQDRDGNLYTGLYDGRIVKILKTGKIEEIVRTGHTIPTCGTYNAEPQCGRPLGLRFDQDERFLIVCDAYFGLLRVNPVTKDIQTLISAKEGVNGRPFKFLNDLAIGSDGTIYFTDTSWKWERRENRYAILEAGGQGRLMSYNPKTGEKSVLLNGLFFANGVELSHDEEFVLVCETTVSRILRYYIRGKKAGIYDLFADNLPGLPDNIRRRKQGGYWLGMATVRKWPFSFLDSVMPYPSIRKFLAKLVSQETIANMIPKYGLVLRLNEHGDIDESLHDPDGAVIPSVSEVHEDVNEGVLYLGSYGEKFLGKLQLKMKDNS